ncbi:MAG: DUF4358 domain-containing protein [Clostridiales bacterium]|nr:DUF4358 domain-containing protein [Clostridiales bacterium]
MKKILVLAVITILSLTLAACAVNDVNNNEVVEDVVSDGNAANEVEKTEEEAEEVVEVTMTLEEIIDQMYLQSGLEFPGTMKSELTAENMNYMLGVDNFDYLEGLASEPMMSSQAHSIVLFTVEDGSDIEVIKADIKANVDGRKWICVGVEPENILVENVGNHIVLIMDLESEALMTAFLDIMN